ncbi:hypothetical protein [uncultured Nostoc sp.]|uniref:hypothetical protein n=1 Tax=uncultured Nostoc sp. TaxID=340711 RepID=UPI0035CB9B8E
MNNLPICPCEGITHPQVIFNPPGQTTISYRIGDYTTFREALLLPLKDINGEIQEQELFNWHPSAKGDLALQMVEWWAYLADILTFYNERIANQAYLQTADLPESLQRLISGIGYRPRPGISAQGSVAALMSDPTKPFTLPQGFQIQSKPGPGKQPQIFELDVDTLIQFPDAIAADPIANPGLLQETTVLLQGTNSLLPSVLLQGTVSNVKAGDNLLLLHNAWSGSTNEYALVTVQKVNPEKDPRGQVNTRVIFVSTPNWLANAQAGDYRLLKSNQYTQVWQYPTGSTNVIGNGQIHLASIVRQIKVNDPILLYQSETQIQLIQVTQYTEVVWNANPTGTPPDPTILVSSRDASIPIPIPIPHTQLSFTASLKVDCDSKTPRATILVYYGWQDVGALIPTPAATFSTTQPEITPEQGFSLSKSQLPLLLEGADGNGIATTASITSSPPVLQLSNSANSSINLKPPLQMLFNLLPVSRGQTVSNEILGSGDASIAGQEFVLKNSPLTYLLSGDSSSGDSYKSTLVVWVNGVEWKEVPSFYGQTGDASIFVTSEDESNNTHVQFGDGVNGARLSSGVNNVVATYRYGSGKDAPIAGTLNVIVKSYPNLKVIHNPVAVSGGADPDPPQQIRRYAPRSVLTLGRAVSGDDYETIAAQAPGVAKAKAYWTWNPEEQRTLVLIYVGDDVNAVNAARVALNGADDPNRPVMVKQAIAIPISLTLTLCINSTNLQDAVVAGVKTALLDADAGLFGANAIQIGQSVCQSQIYAACQSVPGVVAVHGLQFSANTVSLLPPPCRYVPGEGKFYQLLAENLTIAVEGT